MSGLSFLKNVSLQANVKTPIARTKSSTARTPENADIRVFRNGAVYPSAKLVSQCNLQYVGKDVKEKGNGFDVFSSKDFINTQNQTPTFIFIALVAKNAGKVDLFSSTTYEEDGAPKSDVLTQGAVTFGKELLETIKSTYGVELKEGESFMDLKIVSDTPFTTNDNIYWVPKVVSRGDKKGEVTLERRENLTLYALAPVSLLEEEEAQPIEDKAEAVHFALDGEPTLAELEAETVDTPAAAAELPIGILSDDDEDNDTLSV
jgi:hypothetical protein